MQAPLLPPQIAPVVPQTSDPATPPDSDEENLPPQRPQQAPAIASSKEAMLGRRAYTKALDASFQECHSHTSDVDKRAALSRVAEAWSYLDEVDPEGELQLLKALFGRLQADPKLAAQIMPQHIASKQLASLRLPKSPHKNSPSSKARASGLANTSEVVASSSPTSSSPSKNHQQRHPSPSSSPTKLVMSNQNPHMKTLRRKQSQIQIQMEDRKAEERKLDEKMPGRVDKGQEHVGMLADVLYGRWSEGLRGRCGGAVA